MLADFGVALAHSASSPVEDHRLPRPGASRPARRRRRLPMSSVSPRSATRPSTGVPPRPPTPSRRRSAAAVVASCAWVPAGAGVARSRRDSPPIPRPPDVATLGAAVLRVRCCADPADRPIAARPRLRAPAPAGRLVAAVDGGRRRLVALRGRRRSACLGMLGAGRRRLGPRQAPPRRVARLQPATQSGRTSPAEPRRSGMRAEHGSDVTGSIVAAPPRRCVRAAFDDRPTSAPAALESTRRRPRAVLTMDARTRCGRCASRQSARAGLRAADRVDHARRHGVATRGSTLRGDRRRCRRTRSSTPAGRSRRTRARSNPALRDDASNVAAAAGASAAWVEPPVASARP